MKVFKLLVVGVLAVALTAGSLFAMGSSKAEAQAPTPPVPPTPPTVTIDCQVADLDTDGPSLLDTGIIQCSVSVDEVVAVQVTIEFNDANGNGRPDFGDIVVSWSVCGMPPLPTCSA